MCMGEEGVGVEPYVQGGGRGGGGLHPVCREKQGGMGFLAHESWCLVPGASYRAGCWLTKCIATDD